MTPEERKRVADRLWGVIAMCDAGKPEYIRLPAIAALDEIERLRETLGWIAEAKGEFTAGTAHIMQFWARAALGEEQAMNEQEYIALAHAKDQLP